MNFREQYQQQGYLSSVDIVDIDEASRHELEQAEARLGPSHYLAGMHAVRSATDITPTTVDFNPVALVRGDEMNRLRRVISATQ